MVKNIINIKTDAGYLKKSKDLQSHKIDCIIYFIVFKRHIGILDLYAFIICKFQLDLNNGY